MAELKQNWEQFKQILERYGIQKLYHFTDRDNLKSIIDNGGLYSWADCIDKSITIPKPGGDDTSRCLDRRDNLQYYVRVSFVRNHPMQYVAMNDGRISNPVLLEIDPKVIFWKDTKYADRNATKNGANIGDGLQDFKEIHFDSLRVNSHFVLDEDEREFYQAEVLVKNFIPLECITNIRDFGIPFPNNPTQIQSREAYTALITRDTPTAFVFMVDHSGSMSRSVSFNGENMTMADAVSKIVNTHIKELVQRCVKYEDIRHYYDIAVLGYGNDVYSAWQGHLSGRFFVSPKEINDNPYQKITIRKTVKTRRGEEIKEVSTDQWITPRCDGRHTYLYKAIDKAKELLGDWLNDHRGKYCYPPTVINITDGQYHEEEFGKTLLKSNELRSLATNDGNIIFINIHISPKSEVSILFPSEKSELKQDELSIRLGELSSLLPLRYNDAIADVRGDIDNSARHCGLAVNVDVSLLTKLMEIGTPTNMKR